VDTTKTIAHISLCAGYGGIDLGLRRAIPNLRTVAFAEIEAFACANLVAKMEAGLVDCAPIWSDLKTFPWESFRDRVDILTGGYPCQPFRAAGKRAGKNDPRHLWPWIADGIRAMRPRACFFENVEGHITLGLSTVISDLEELGYRVAWGIFSASECGAPHQRKRVFVLAHSGDERLQGEKWVRQAGTKGEPIGHFAEFDGNLWPSRPGEPQHRWEPSRVVVNAASQLANSRQQFCDEEFRQGRALPLKFGHSSKDVGNAAEQGCQRSGRTNDPRGTIDRPTESNGGCAYGQMEQSPRQAQPSVGGDANGSTSGMDYAELCVTCDNRTDELRLLGNGVVPAAAEKAFRELIKKLN
jgi:DNA (cytosine-5)-methyltransferase 1